MNPDELSEQARTFERWALQCLLARNGTSDALNRWYEGRADGLRSAATMLRLVARWETDEPTDDAAVFSTLNAWVEEQVLPGRRVLLDH